MADNENRAGWAKLGPKALNAAVDFYAGFLPDPDRAAVEQWVLERLKPSAVYDGGYSEWYDELCDEGVLPEATLRDFSRQFLPNTPEWFRFAEEYEGTGAFIAAYCDSVKLVGVFGEWSDHAIDLLDLLLDCWKFDYSYGIWASNSGPQAGPLRIHLDARDCFWGRGRPGLSDLFTNLDRYTREWFAAHGGPEKEYAELLALMEDKRLEIRLDFLDALMDDGKIREKGYLYSDGSALRYEQVSRTTWTDWD